MSRIRVQLILHNALTFRRSGATGILICNPSHTVARLFYEIRVQLDSIPAEHAIYIMIADNLISMNKTIGEVYMEHAMRGTLNIHVYSENSFGCIDIACL